MNTSMSLLALELAKKHGVKVVCIDSEITAEQMERNMRRRENQVNVRQVVEAIRYARLVLKDPKICTSVKYAIAGFTRDLVREARDLKYISFDCCTALQRALDY